MMRFGQSRTQKSWSGVTIPRGHACGDRDEWEEPSTRNVSVASRIVRKGGIAMQNKSGVLRIIFMVGLLLGSLAVPGIAAQDVAREAALPRAFQGASLGMPLSDFAAVVPEAKRVSLARRDQTQRTVVVPSKDRFLQRVEYRFSDDQLRELVIHYNPSEVPGGYQRLLERLRESYGKPIAENLQEYDSGPDVVLVKKTVWKDHATMASLTESRKIFDDRRELILTITDRNLQQAFEEDQEHRRRQRELSIPVPTSDHVIQNRQAAMSRSESMRDGHAGG